MVSMSSLFSTIAVGMMVMMVLTQVTRLVLLDHEMRLYSEEIFYD